MGKFIDLTGKTFGRLTVLRQAGKDSQDIILWACLCSCGNYKIVRGQHLRNGSIQSCGCLRQESSSKIGKKNKKHGLEGTRLYHIWCSMKGRCYRPSALEYDNYGGRDIKVCEEWQTFEPFMKWALSNGYSDNLTIDRIKNDEGYCPENCRWIGYKEQANNRRNNRMITAFGETLTLSQWSEKMSINSSTIRGRLARGWDAEKALTITPSRGNNYQKGRYE